MPNFACCPPADLNAGAGIRKILPLSALLLCLLLAAAGCAKVADPQPPEILVPRPALDLKAIQVSDRITLTVSPPGLNTNGSPATTLRDIEIFRLIRSDREDAGPISEADFIRQAEMLATIPVAQIDEFLSGGIIVFQDPLAFPDRSAVYARAFRYAVRFVNQRNQTAGLSNQAFLAPVPIPPPPSDLKAEVTEHFIRLTWTPPDLNMDGSSPPRIAGYNVYRSEDPGKFPSAPLNPSPLLLPRFEDRSFHFDRKYYYAVSVVGHSENPYAESLPAESLPAAPLDIFPPGPPRNLNAVPDGKIVFLLWAPPPEEDVAGYHIYRKEDGEPDHRRLNRELAVRLSYQDETAESGKIYEYRVSAVDTHGNEGARSQAGIEVP